MPPTHPSFDVWATLARPRLLRLARAWLKEKAEAEDVVQATLEALWHADRQGRVLNLDAYADRAVWLNAQRRKARWKDWEALDGSPAASRGPREEELELTPWEMEAAIEQLPPAQQAVIRLRFYGGLSFQETGKALKISINTAASRCRYALAALRAALEPKEEKSGDD